MKKTILIIAAAAALAIVPAGSLLAQDAVQTTSVTTNAAGTISDFGPQTIVVRSDTAAAPVRYTYTKNTTYVDQDGNPVSMETVKSGLPVTVYYTRDGGDLVASKVVVRKTVVAPAAPVIEQPPVSENRSTTTTTTTTNK
ncbi:MAG TPA: hypothetical protein VHY22_01405 [Chthoniobacteraceae bacterium]|nr:hypothetical protein [Chthoniobacteraceae bacterium]